MSNPIEQMNLNIDLKKLSKDEKEILYSRISVDTMKYIEKLAKQSGYEKKIGNFLDALFRQIKNQNS